MKLLTLRFPYQFERPTSVNLDCKLTITGTAQQWDCRQKPMVEVRLLWYNFYCLVLKHTSTPSEYLPRIDISSVQEKTVKNGTIDSVQSTKGLFHFIFFVPNWKSNGLKYLPYISKEMFSVELETVSSMWLSWYRTVFLGKWEDGTCRLSGSNDRMRW